uniref:Uncharacterized protein n=1 Tax=Romanomermis culicivorax TaxID=13658 RepID=A0A915IZV5_ROMCU
MMKMTPSSSIYLAATTAFRLLNAWTQRTIERPGFLTGISASEDDIDALNGRDLTPKYCRPCLCLARNKLQTNFFAFGLEKNRADNSVFIYDMENMGENNFNKRVYELESCYSLAWMKQNHRLLAASLSNKCIKIYDLSNFAK